MKRVLAVFVGTLLLSVLSCSKVEQQADSGSMGTTSDTHGEEMAAKVDHARAELHGGTALDAAGHLFEVVYLPDGIRVYAYDGNEAPVSLAGATGEVALEYTKPEASVASVAMVYTGAPEVEMGNEILTANDYLFAAVDLSGVQTGSVNLGFAITGLTGGSGEAAEFETSFGLITERPYSCPMHTDAWGETAESLCPICGDMKTTALRVAK
jgi:hypothetical protein